MKPLVIVALTVGVSAGPMTSAAREVARAAATRPMTRPAAFAPDLSGLLTVSPEESARQQAHLQRLRSLLDDAADPLDQAVAHLAIANTLLAVSTAEPATRWIIGAETAADLTAMASSAAAAREHLARARALLQRREGSPGDEGNARRARLERTADTLEPFAMLFAAPGAREGPDAPRSAYANVALRLSALREADDPDLAACALLWQSFAWERAGRRARALTALPDVLTRPQRLPYDFLSRLLRCRIMADAGQHAAALTLAIRMQDLCGQWFPDAPPADVEASRLLIILLQGRVGLAWLEPLQASDASAAGQLEDMLAGLRETIVREGSGLRAYHPPSAVPVIIDLAEIKPRIASSSSAPATAPASAPASAGGDQAPRRASTQSSPSF